MHEERTGKRGPFVGCTDVQPLAHERAASVRCCRRTVSRRRAAAPYEPYVFRRKIYVVLRTTNSQVPQYRVFGAAACFMALGTLTIYR